MSKPPAFDRIFAQLSCSDIVGSRLWFEKFFGRAPDAEPMAGLSEWHHQKAAGLQLFENADNAGRGTLTVIVSDLKAEHARTEALGLKPGPIEAATTTSLVRLHDPDGNLVVLAQPGEA